MDFHITELNVHIPIALSGSIKAYYLHRYIDSNLMLLQEGKLECITPPQPGEQ
jgi:hypothetical protein